MTTPLAVSPGLPVRSFALRRALLALAAAALLPAAPGALAGPREEARLLEATAVLEDAQAMPDQWAPDQLLRRAQGIAVLPHVIKGALIVGGRGGKGVLVVRDAQGRWSNPALSRSAAVASASSGVWKPATSSSYSRRARALRA